METQEQFLFADGPAPELHMPDPLSDFYDEVASAWQIPVGQKVHVALREHNFADLDGRLELARAPDLPLDQRTPLDLRIGTIDFSSTQIVAWALA